MALNQMESTWVGNCTAAGIINRNAVLASALTCVMILDATSLFLLSVFAHCYVFNKALHPNYRAMVASVTLTLVVRNSLTFIRAFRMLADVVFAGDDDCALLKNSRYCKIEGIINSAPLDTANWGFPIVVAERVVATVLYKSYERQQYLFIAVPMALLPWVIQGSMVVMSIANTISMPVTRIPYCSSLGNKAVNPFEILKYQLPIAAITIGVGIPIYFINRKASLFGTNNASGSMHLSARFQRLEIVEATKLITIYTVFFTSCSTINLSVVAYYITGITDVGLQAASKEASALIFPLYGNLYVIIALLVSSRFRQRFFDHPAIKRITPASARCMHTKVTPLASPQDYFNMYHKQWA